jgi:hypothetical protein
MKSGMDEGKEESFVSMKAGRDEGEEDSCLVSILKQVGMKGRKTAV